MGHLAIHLAMPLCLDLSLFVQTSLSSDPSQSRSFCSLGFPVAFLSFLLIPPFSKACVLSQCLFSAVTVVFMVVALSLHLLVTEEVAPPAFRVVHLFGRPSTPPHFPFV